MYRSVMVPVDGSFFGDLALGSAMAIAKRTGARLHIVHVRTEPVNIVSTEQSNWIDEERAQLANAGARAEAALGRPVVLRLLEAGVEEESHRIEPRERIAQALGDYIRDHAIDLVVMTTHGRGGMRRALLGSVATELMQRTTVPLLLIRPARLQGANGSAVIGPKHILITLDGTTFAEQAIAPALALGELFGARFTLVRVIEPRVHTENIYIPYTAFPSPERIAEQREESLDYLESVAKRMREYGAQVDVAVTVGGEVAELIGLLAREQGTDAIAIATHAPAGLSRLLEGSVADELVRSGERPVLVLHGRPPA